jgi:hypothetical protein
MYISELEKTHLCEIQNLKMNVFTASDVELQDRFEQAAAYCAIAAAAANTADWAAIPARQRFRAAQVRANALARLVLAYVWYALVGRSHSERWTAVVRAGGKEP